MNEEPKSKDNDGVLDGELSALKIAAIQVHEMFLELKAAGFAHQDAVQIIGTMLTSGVLFNPAATFGFSFEELDPNDEEDESLEYGDGEDGDFPL